MRVCLETSSLRPPVTGIGIYTISLARSLLREARDIEFSTFDGTGFNRLTDRSLEVSQHSGGSNSIVDRAARVVRRSRHSRQLYRWLKARRFQQKAASFDLFHALNFVAPLDKTAPVLPLIHDLSFERMPEMHPSDRVAFLRKRLAKVHDFPLINTLSHFSAGEIAAFYGYPLERIHVTHPGVDERFHALPTGAAIQALGRMGLSARSFFLSVGTLEPRKNHKVLIEAYRGLEKTFRQRFPLVIVGAEGWGMLNVRGQDALVNEGSVRFLGYLSDELVHALYAQACALLFPSVYEGFGMPVTEGMAGGLQPLVSNIPVMHEVAGDAGIFTDPHDAPAWGNVIVAAAETKPDREKLVQKAQQFTWPQTARKTAEIYRHFERA